MAWSDNPLVVADERVDADDLLMLQGSMRPQATGVRAPSCIREQPALSSSSDWRRDRDAGDCRVQLWRMAGDLEASQDVFRDERLQSDEGD